MGPKKTMMRIRTLKCPEHLKASSVSSIQYALARQSSEAVNSAGSKTDWEVLDLPLNDLDELEQVNYTL